MTVINPRADIKQWSRLGDTALTQMLLKGLVEFCPDISHVLVCGHPGDIEMSLSEDDYRIKCYELFTTLREDCMIDYSFETNSSRLSQKEYYAHIRKLCERYKPDVIHIQQAQVAASHYIDSLQRDVGVPVIWTLHNPPEGRSTFQYSEDYRSLFHNADCEVICVSNSARSRLMDTLKLDVCPSNLNVIYNGVLDHEDSLADRDIDFIAVGRIDPPKSTDMILDFMARHPDKRSVFIGSTFSTYDTSPDYTKLCYEKIDRGVHAGYLTHYESMGHEMVMYLMRRSKYYVNLSRVETFSLTSCEAMMMGTPVICFDEAGPGEIVPAEFGLKIKPVYRRRTSAYLQDLDKMLEYDDYKSRYNHSMISTYAKTTYSVKRMARSYADLYERKVNNNDRKI